jgi:transcriptional regulator
MYTPNNFRITDTQEAVGFMRKYSFATLVTSTNNIPLATHLPFLVEQRDDKIVLVSHFAKANPQANTIAEGTSLVIFTEPHAYISPKHYEKELNVPTWNYLAVHAYGKALVIEDKEKVAALLEKTITNYEADYLTQWNKLPADYKFKMMNGIVAFEIVVDDVQGKKKLSQNKTEQERQNIINSFSKSPDSNERDIAGYMASLNKAL